MLRFLRYLGRTCKRRLGLIFKGRRFFPLWPSLLLSATPPKKWYACFSKGIMAIDHLDLVVEGKVVLLPAIFLTNLLVRRGGCGGVLFWGVKEALAAPSFRECLDLEREKVKNSFLSKLLTFARALTLYVLKKNYRARLRFARDLAKKHNLPLLRLEDGFLRSLDLGVKGAAPLSLVLDRLGMYYDATRPSELENLLSSSWEASPALLNEAKKAIELLIAWDLSKYNHSPKITAAELGEKSGKRILVLDQTKGDVSVALGLANEATFTTMLQAALNEHPSALILVKVHPDVLSGRKKGYFKPSHLPSNVRLLSTDCSPLSLLALVDEVYTVTSQMGFEALFLGKKVHCFGLPFYAGWGLTCDRLTSQRRGKKRSLQEVFAASYLLYAKYLDLASGKLVNFFQVASLLRLERQINEENRGFRACLGFSAWKHEHASAFLASTQGTVKFYEDEDKALRDCCEFKGKLVVWSSKESPNLAKKACDLGVEVLRMEDGFIRSIGLGSNYHLPGSLVLDDLGIYYDPTRESRLERLLNSPISPELICEAKQISELLVQQGISKYNMQGGNDLPILPTDRKIILVPGQVEDDASVRLGGQGIFSNTALLEAVRKAEPTSYILYKEHPDVVSGNRLGKVQPEALSRLADGVVRSTPIEVVLPLCQEVHTLTSLTGFEALLRGLTVVSYGGPFYAGWGLTRDRLSFPRRKRRLQLFELVAATLLLYPRYYDWEHKCFISCASFVEWLAKRRSSV